MGINTSIFKTSPQGKSFIAMLLGLIAAIWGIVYVTDIACRRSAANHDRADVSVTHQPALGKSRVPYAVIESKQSNNAYPRQAITISVPKATSPSDIESAMEFAARRAKSDESDLGAVMVWATFDSDPRTTVRGGQFAPGGDWSKASNTVPVGEWAWQSMGEMNTQRY